MNSKIDFCNAPIPNPGPHWWHVSQTEDRRRGHYFWTSNEIWCYGPFEFKPQAEEAKNAHEAGLPIPDFDEENAT